MSDVENRTRMTRIKRIYADDFEEVRLTGRIGISRKLTALFHRGDAERKR